MLGGIDRGSISFKLDKNVFALETADCTLHIERLTTWDYHLQKLKFNSGNFLEIFAIDRDEMILEYDEKWKQVEISCFNVEWFNPYI